MFPVVTDSLTSAAWGEVVVQPPYEASGVVQAGRFRVWGQVRLFDFSFILGECPAHFPQGSLADLGRNAFTPFVGFLCLARSSEPTGNERLPFLHQHIYSIYPDYRDSGSHRDFLHPKSFQQEQFHHRLGFSPLVPGFSPIWRFPGWIRMEHVVPCLGYGSCYSFEPFNLVQFPFSNEVDYLVEVPALLDLQVFREPIPMVWVCRGNDASQAVEGGWR